MTKVGTRAAAARRKAIRLRRRADVLADSANELEALASQLRKRKLTGGQVAAAVEDIAGGLRSRGESAYADTLAKIARDIRAHDAGKELTTTNKR